MAKTITTDEILTSIKTRIKDWNDYFRPNIKRFIDSRRFTFETSLDTYDEEALDEMGRPSIEFNIQEAYISRIRGEFAKQEPTLTVSPVHSYGVNVDPGLIRFLEQYLKQLLFDSNKDDLQFDVFTDTLSGGFSAIKVVTEYESQMGPSAFDQRLMLERFFDPTLSVFDKSARLSHKGDGRFSAELFPKSYDEIKSEFGGDVAKKIKFSTHHDLGGFQWSYTTDSGEKYALIADYYEKRTKRKKIVKLAPTQDGQSIVMTEKDYEKFSSIWEETMLEQLPVVIDSRYTEVDTIDRYILCGDHIIEHYKTNWGYLPHIFVDGNSVPMKKSAEGASYQLCKPYLYQATGIQKLKNFAGQTLGAELENIVQSKFMYCTESIPSMYEDAMVDIQKASILFFDAYDKNNPDKQLPAPQPVPRSGVPPEVTQTFMMCDQMMQAIVGSYDAALGINGGDISGKAILAGATQSNPVVMPYMINYVKALTQAGNVILDRIPKTIKTPRTIPITDKNGQVNFVKINQQGGISLEFDARSLEINIEPGVSFELQRQRALEVILQLMQTNQDFAEFVSSTPDGMNTILDNIEIRGIEQLRESIGRFLQEKAQRKQMIEQMQQQQAQQQMQRQAQELAIINRPAELKEQEIKLKAAKDAADIRIKQDQLAIDLMKAEAEIKSQAAETAVRVAEVEARNIRSAVDLERSIADGHHSKAMDLMGMKMKYKPEGKD